jgi:hypothetical protein
LRPVLAASVPISSFKRPWVTFSLISSVLREKIKGCILRNIDIAYWERCSITERAERESLVEVMESWKSLLSIGAHP